MVRGHSENIKSPFTPASGEGGLDIYTEDSNRIKRMYAHVATNEHVRTELGQPYMLIFQKTSEKHRRFLPFARRPSRQSLALHHHPSLLTFLLAALPFITNPSLLSFSIPLVVKNPDHHVGEHRSGQSVLESPVEQVPKEAVRVEKVGCNLIE